MARKLKIMENEKHPLDDLKNDEITEKREKWKMHTVGPGIWQKTEIGGKWDPHTLGTGIWRETVEMWKNVK